MKWWLRANNPLGRGDPSISLPQPPLKLKARIQQMTDLGWIKLHRKIMSNSIYKKSTLYHLFNHCLLCANHRPQDILYGGELIKLKAGEFATTLKEISKETGIKKPTVYKGLKTLSNINLISQKGKQRLTIISVINWHTYQKKVNDRETMGKR